MIKERYVNLEVAKLLRDKGFDGEVHNWYVVDENIQAPSQAVACDWIEETFDISIEVFAVSIGYGVSIRYTLKGSNITSNAVKCRNNMVYGDNPDKSWSSKELAYNAALKYVLTNLV